MIIQIATRIKELREQYGITQSQLANKMDVTRSSVNAWEMGISLPCLSKVIELALFFHVSTDYLLGIESNEVISLDTFTFQEKELVSNLIMYISNMHQ